MSYCPVCLAVPASQAADFYSFDSIDIWFKTGRLFLPSISTSIPSYCCTNIKHSIPYHAHSVSWHHLKLFPIEKVANQWISTGQYANVQRYEPLGRDKNAAAKCIGGPLADYHRVILEHFISMCFPEPSITAYKYCDGNRPFYRRFR